MAKVADFIAAYLFQRLLDAFAKVEKQKMKLYEIVYRWFLFEKSINLNLVRNIITETSIEMPHVTYSGVVEPEQYKIENLSALAQLF